LRTKRAEDSYSKSGNSWHGGITDFMTERKQVISIIIPVWNEEDTIPPLIERLQELSDESLHCFDFIFVNDGSADRTQEKLLELLHQLPRWRVIKLSRNFGQQPAYRAGLDQADGDAVVFLDGDLQDPPEVIPAMIALWERGSKVVIARRRSRPERGLRGFLMRRFHDIFHAMTGGLMPKGSGTFGLMDRKVAGAVKAMPELNIFLPALRSWVGYPREFVWYDRVAREGKPKQTLSKLFNYAWDGILSFSELPLKTISWIGVVTSLVGFGYATVLIAIKISQLFGYFTEFIVPGFTTIAVAVLCVGGVQLISLGVLGQYIARIYREVKQRPLYLIEEIVSSTANESRRV
jgi:glycosyltransferase involved in cell wall biosynthesis